MNNVMEQRATTSKMLKQEQQFLASSAKKLKFITCGYTVSHSYGLI